MTHHRESKKDMALLPEHEARLHEWLRQNRADFSHALGLWADDDLIVESLMNMKACIDNTFGLFKTRLDQKLEGTLEALRASDGVDAESLRKAVLLLHQAYAAACRRVHRLEEDLKKRPGLPVVPRVGKIRRLDR